MSLWEQILIQQRMAARDAFYRGVIEWILFGRDDTETQIAECYQ